MKLLLIACVDSAVIDRNTNRLSMFHLFEDYSSTTFPVSIPGISLVAVLSRTKDEPQKIEPTVRFALGRKELINISFPIDFQGHLRARAIGQIQGLVVPSHGLLQVSLRIGKKTLGSWPIRFNLIGESEASIQMVSSKPS